MEGRTSQTHYWRSLKGGWRIQVSVGTCNLNNLFSRFNFSSAIEQIQSGGPSGAATVRYVFTDADSYRIRTFLGKLVKAKPAADTDAMAQRILSMDVDVLAVQKVEDNPEGVQPEEARGLYSVEVLIEGNDPRFIDVGILSRRSA